MTEQNMRESLAGESQAYIKYMAFAARADKEGKPNVARLFRAAAFAEKTHATEQAQVLGLVGDTATNLAAAKAGEAFEMEEMYPAHRAVAELQEETAAQQAIKHALAAEECHEALYAQALEAVGKGGDMDLGLLWVCGMCGYTATSEMPERCPVCNAPRKYFEEF